MLYFWEKSRKIKFEIKKSDKISLFLDFDGTLSPLVTIPTKTKLPKNVKKLLRKLVKINKISLAIISGRMLEDIKKKVNVSGILYSGNHGMEWEFNGKRFTTSVPKKTHEALRQIKTEMEKVSANFKGSFVEDKKFSVAFHYRGVYRTKKAFVAEILKPILDKYLETKLVSLLSGRQVFDMRANVNWTKGSLVRHYKKLLETDPGNIIYIGDSASDEDAFKALKDSITIKVGYSETSFANYYLEDEKDVEKFLKWLLKAITL